MRIRSLPEIQQSQQSRRLTPGEAIRQWCVDCVNGIYNTHTCGGDKLSDVHMGNNGMCYFYPYRQGTGRPSVKLIRKICLECMGMNEKDTKGYVRDCDNQACVLYPYRFGKNPYMTGRGNILKWTKKLLP